MPSDQAESDQESETQVTTCLTEKKSETQA